MIYYKLLWLCSGAVLLAGCQSVQRADPAFQPLIAQPTYAEGAGPTVWIDEGHHNIVATVGRYGPFVATLRSDGYVVRPYRTKFTSIDLGTVTLLVIGNALHRNNVDNWSTPAPPAFEPSEIRAVRDWVASGGSLLLLIDHQPFPSAAADLAAAFGLELLDGYVEDPETWDPIVFRRTDGGLRSHPVTDGIGATDRVESVGTFDGSAFRSLGDVRPLLVLSSRHFSYHPARSWEINANTPTRSVEGWLQGAALEVGLGRVVVFADATMFSAQLGPQDGIKLGMNTPQGAGNLQLLRNVMRWLTRHVQTTERSG